MATVAHHSFSALFATTEKHDAILFGCEGFGFEIGPFMAAIAEGLVGAFAAGTPMNGFAFFYR